MSRLGLALAALLLPAAAAAAVETGWIEEAARVEVAAGDTVHAVVVTLDHRVEIEAAGRSTTVERGAIRIVDREGANHATAAVFYDNRSGTVRRLTAWVVRGGKPRALAADRAVDLAYRGDAAYSELRWRTIDATRDVEPGDVFAWESVVEERSIFRQDVWAPPGDVPVRLARYTLVLPAGWTAEGRAVGAAAAAGAGAGPVWELRDLPAIDDDEPAMPPQTSLVPRIVTTWSPPAGAGRRDDAPSFASWSEVARWLYDLSDPMHAGTDETRRRAEELVRGAGNRTDSIEAVARWVQRLRYAAIPLGVSRGGGYKPYPAATVLSRAYGDCKDKANLMRSLLASVGIGSRLSVVYSGDAEYAREDWPSPYAFNHCILAIDAPRPLDTTARDGAGRSWTFFDPTDPYTELGDLPDEVQGAITLVIDPATTAPLRLPRLGAGSRLDRRSELRVAADGTVAGTVRFDGRGQMGRTMRGWARLGTPVETRKAFERGLAAEAPGVRIDSLELREERGRVRSELRFTARRYAQLMQDRIMVLRPYLMGSSSLPSLGEKRRHPIALDASATVDTVAVHLPEGFAVDELPEPVTIETKFGRYITEATADGNVIQLTRSLTVEPKRLPVTDYPEVRAFFGRVLASDATPVVLVRR